MKLLRASTGFDEWEPGRNDERQAGSLRVAYLFTRFPHVTETFLQREVLAMRELGLAPVLHSLHRGEGKFAGATVHRFNKWRLLLAPWLALWECALQPSALTDVAGRLFLTWPRDWLNHWENLYGAGIAVVMAREVRNEKIDHIHAVWASLPATTAWVLSRLTGVRFSMGAHAYDLFEHGGDWLLLEKCRAASFVHTSTANGRGRLLALGVEGGKVLLARRGLFRPPPCRTLRKDRSRLRVLCIARLVEKKGLFRQLAIYGALLARGLSFEVRIVGDGPLGRRLSAEIHARALEGNVSLAGPKTSEQVWSELARADVLVHTGVVSDSGDRDGLPNVVPEAMASGVLVVTAPGAGVLEAVSEGLTGLVCPLDDPEAWHRAFRRLQTDDAFSEALRRNARAWVDENFDAVKNAGLILARFREPGHQTPARQSLPAPSCDVVV